MWASLLLSLFVVVSLLVVTLCVFVVGGALCLFCMYCVLCCCALLLVVLVVVVGCCVLRCFSCLTSCSVLLVMVLFFVCWSSVFGCFVVVDVVFVVKFVLVRFWQTGACYAAFRWHCLFVQSVACYVIFFVGNEGANLFIFFVACYVGSLLLVFFVVGSCSFVCVVGVRCSSFRVVVLFVL